MTINRTKSVRPRESHIFAKAKDGWYVEPEWCSARLFDVEDFAPTIFDPACGGGNILKSASLHRYDTYGMDIVKRGMMRREWNFTRADFMGELFLGDRTLSEWRQTFSIVCNPPFDHVEEFCRRACAQVDKVAMLMLTRRLNAAHWLDDLPLKTIYLLTPRPSMPPGEWIKAGNKPGGGTQDFCWLIFERGYKGAPNLKWLHRDARGEMRCRSGRLCKPSRGASTSPRNSLSSRNSESTSRGS